MNDEPEPVKSQMHCTAVTANSLVRTRVGSNMYAASIYFSHSCPAIESFNQRTVQESTNRRVDSVTLPMVTDGVVRSILREMTVPTRDIMESNS